MKISKRKHAVIITGGTSLRQSTEPFYVKKPEARPKRIKALKNSSG